LYERKVKTFIDGKVGRKKIKVVLKM